MKKRTLSKIKKTGLTAGICNLKYFLRCIRNPASVVRSLVYEPYYLFVRISYNKLTALIKQIKLAICQIITYQLGAIHPERNESVTGRRSAHNKRKSDLRQICKKAISVSYNFYIRPVIYNLYPKLRRLIIYISSCLRYNKPLLSFIRQWFNENIFTVDKQSVGS